LIDFLSIQKGPSPSQKNKIKYGCEGLVERNNFIRWNFSRLKMDFKLKFREVSRLGI
jgi:hypothetical protein